MAFVSAMVGEPAADQAFAAFGVPQGPGEPRALDFVATWKMMAADVEAVGDESHGVATSGAPVGAFEMMCGAFLQGADLADGFRRMARFTQVMQTDMQLRVRTARGGLQVTGVSRSPLTTAREAYTDAFALVLYFALRWMAGSAAQPARVESSRHLVPDLGAMLGLIGPPVFWRDEGFALVYDQASAAAPLRPVAAEAWLDGAYREFLARLAERAEEARRPQEAPDIAERVRLCLLGGRAAQPQVASALGMSVATLRRRLADEGQSFRGVRDAIRRDAARMLLGADRPAKDIAADLGLSDARSLRRACRAWFGAAPSEVRRALALSASRPETDG